MLFAVNQGLFALTYTVFRIFWWTLNAYSLYSAAVPALLAADWPYKAPRHVLVVFLLAHAFLTVLQIVWFRAIFQAFLDIVRPKPEESKKEE